jgi:hypothetical protein
MRAGTPALQGAGAGLGVEDLADELADFGGAEVGFAESAEGADGDGAGLCFGVIADEHHGGEDTGRAEVGDQVDAGGTVAVEKAVDEDEVVLPVGEELFGIGGGGGAVDMSIGFEFKHATDAQVIGATLTDAEDV